MCVADRVIVEHSVKPTIWLNTGMIGELTNEKVNKPTSTSPSRFAWECEQVDLVRSQLQTRCLHKPAGLP